MRQYKVPPKYQWENKERKAMKNRILAVVLMLGIWVPFILITVEEVTNGAVNFGFTDTALFVAGICIFGAIPLASISLLKK